MVTWEAYCCVSRWLCLFQILIRLVRDTLYKDVSEQSSRLSATARLPKHPLARRSPSAG